MSVANFASLQVCGIIVTFWRVQLVRALLSLAWFVTAKTSVVRVDYGLLYCILVLYTSSFPLRSARAPNAN